MASKRVDEEFLEGSDMEEVSLSLLLMQRSMFLET